MAYDGIVTAAVVRELNDRLLMGSISKVAQPEKDELLLTLKCSRQQLRLCISANASTPMVYLREENELSPATAPNFCMTLRKHIGGGRITRIFQPSASGFGGNGGAGDPEGTGDASGSLPLHEGLERIIVFEIEHLDEMGDVSRKYLICELMGKHSNIILTKPDLTIIDSIKHVSHMTSSVREVLPGRTWFIPDAAAKANPVTLCRDAEAFRRVIRGGAGNESIFKHFYLSVTGISPSVSGEILHRAGVDPDLPHADLSDDESDRIFTAFSGLMQDVLAGRFEPCIIYDGDRLSEFSAVRLSSLEGGDLSCETFGSISEVIRLFYERRDRQNRIRAKSEDIRRVLKTLTERASKKLELLEKQYKDTDKRDQYRIWGELLNTYGYSLNGGEDHLVCSNYYDEGRDIRIPLDRNLSAQENAKKYFERYQKLKRTREAVSRQIGESRQTLWHLDSIASSLQLCEGEADLNELRREMAEAGYIHKGSDKNRSGKVQGNRKNEKKSQPLHFVSSDGIDIYVGRNNYQNEELDFKIADSNDWWFHAKNRPGSHVIAKTGSRELPDRTCLEAAQLAAYYSKAGIASQDNPYSPKSTDSTEKIEVDYVRKRELKRVPGAAPGYVIYHTNYSIVVEPRATV
ncbi:MAG: NFACT family protein [Lachnospiraceae bacterium]|nr:NFACT family protein [Lachnospiraceae bacterium]